jgi:hypothetical protein
MEHFWDSYLFLFSVIWRVIESEYLNCAVLDIGLWIGFGLSHGLDINLGLVFGLSHGFDINIRLVLGFSQGVDMNLVLG